METIRVRPGLLMPASARNKSADGNEASIASIQLNTNPTNTSIYNCDSGMRDESSVEIRGLSPPMGILNE